MKNTIDIAKLKLDYEAFKVSPDYENRKSQLCFIELAQLIIRELVKRNKITKRDLTAFIQLLKYNCKKDNFAKYLKGLALSEVKNASIAALYNKLIDAKITGFTGAGKAAINKLSTKQLNTIHNFIRNIDRANDYSNIKDSVLLYESEKIPEVKSGVFSPWIYYLKPDICPIVNSKTAIALKALGWDGKYSTAMDIFENIKDIVNEDNLGFIDAYLYKHSIPMISIHSHKTQFQSKIGCNTILYGPPGTGKTYKTKEFAINIISPTSAPIEKGESPQSLATSSPLLEALEKYVMSLKGSNKIPDKKNGRPMTSMTAYNTEDGRRLVWIRKNKTISLRNEKNGQYPKELRKELKLKKTWGNYPEFTISKEKDLDIAIRLIDYAYKHL